MALFTNGKLFSHMGKCLLNASIRMERRTIKRFVAPVMMDLVKRNKEAKPLPIEKTRRSKYVEWNYNAEIYSFGKRLGEEFKIELLLQAFIHRSYVIQEELKQEQVGIENPNLTLKDNQPLAKQGQAVISAEVKRFLGVSLPRLPLEGILALHDYLLSDDTLGDISKNIGTSEIILSSDYPVQVVTYSDTLKAIVGALAESQSVERANKFVRDIIITRLAEKDLNDIYVIKDPLNVLTEILKRENKEAPELRLIGQSAMNEILATYTVGVYCSKKLIGQGPGETVQIATEMAARDALKRLFCTSDSSAPLNFDIDNQDTPANLKLSQWKSTAFQQSA